MAKNKNRAIKIENEQVENVREKAYIETKLDDFKEEDNVEITKVEEAKVEEVKVENIEDTTEKKEKKRTGTVISVSKISIIVEDENGNGYTLFNHPDAKYGDIIEF